MRRKLASSPAWLQSLALCLHAINKASVTGATRRYAANASDAMSLRHHDGAAAGQRPHGPYPQDRAGAADAGDGLRGDARASEELVTQARKSMRRWIA
jgi:hypothetical protein